MTTEQIIRIGPAKALVGIASFAVSRSISTGMIIVNAGIIHKVGPSRLHVEMARAFAGAGGDALRFDLSGIGDSEPREEPLPPFESAVSDLRAAMDSFGAARGLGKFVLVGLCSGANHSIACASVDPRVVGVVLLDPFIPRTAGYYLRRFGSRLFRVSSWGNVISGRHPIWNRVRGPRVISEPDSVAARPYVAPSTSELEQLRRVYATAVERGVEFFVALTGDLESHHNYARQFSDAFPGVDFDRRLALHYYGDADHEYSLHDHRRRLIEAVVGWVHTSGF